MWFHCVVNFDSSSMKMNVYVNNVLTISNAPLTASNILPSLSFPGFRLGRSKSSTDFSFAGNIADFRVYSALLTTAEISAIYNGNL